MTFLPRTVEELREKVAELEGTQESVKADLNYFAERAAYYQAQHEGVSRTIADYNALLAYAENWVESEAAFPGEASAARNAESEAGR